MPDTVNVPFEPLTVPTESMPSPQLMFAVKPTPWLAVLLSWNVATVPSKSAPSVALNVAAWAVNVLASATVAVVLAVAVGPLDALVAIVTWTVKVPGSG